jgi:tetratricopeptide (TPR) repeat protein
MSRTPVCAAIVLLLLPVASSAQPKPPTADQIARWIKDLGDNNFDVRETASRRLWEAGEAAEAAVMEALKSGDAEVVRRASDLADKFRWGIYPDTPPKVLELIGRYRVGDENTRVSLVREMFDAGACGCTTLLKIARAEKDATVRRRVLEQINREASRAVPALLAGGNFASLETLLELCIAADDEAALPNYAAYWLLRGRLDEAVSRWKVEAARPDSRRALEVLAHLYRAKGDLAAARAVAEKTDRADLVEDILCQQGDWKALAKRPTSERFRLNAEVLGYRAAFCRLGGNATALDQALTELRKYAEGREGCEAEGWHAIKALFLNDRPVEALALLARCSRHADVYFEVLVAQGRYREALAAADALPGNHPDRPLVEVLRGRTLSMLGEKEKARAVFVGLGNGIKDCDEAPWHERLLEVEYRLGLRDLACEHCARLLMAAKVTARTELLGKVFPGREEEATALWAYLRAAAGKSPDPVAIMNQVHDLLEGRVAEKELTALAAAMGKDGAAEDRAARMLALATAKDEALAKTFLEKAAALGSAAALLRLGDAAAARKEWTAAAGRYAEAWDRDRNDPLPLFLRGDALVRAGRPKEGELWIERARLLPLGDEQARRNFADGLDERGHAGEARRQRDLLIRLSGPGSFHAGDALRQLALDAAERHDNARAAELHEKAMLRCLDARVSFAEGGAYVAVPEAIHRHRARALIAAGRLDEARKQMALCEAALPDDVALPCVAVPALDQAGRKKDADELFGRCLALHEKTCRDYPKSAREHNALAWLSACCRRQLDRGLEHAHKAVALEPDAAGFLDTLGEVYFQRGEKEKALAAVRRCVELDPKSDYYRRQIKRVEAGDPKAELP